jgi:hypothetical protein
VTGKHARLLRINAGLVTVESFTPYLDEVDSPMATNGQEEEAKGLPTDGSDALFSKRNTRKLDDRNAAFFVELLSSQN